MWLEPTQGSEFVYYTDFTLKNGNFIQEIVQAFYLCDGRLFLMYRIFEAQKVDVMRCGDIIIIN